MPDINNNRANQPQPNQVTIAIEQGSRALGFRDIGFADEPRRVAQPAVAATAIDLARAIDLGANGANIAQLLGIESIAPDGDPKGNVPLSSAIDQPAGATTVIDPLATVRENSQAARAGAFVFLPPDGRSPGYNAATAAYSATALARVVDPAQFLPVTDGTSAIVSAKPVHDLSFGYADMDSYAIRFTLSRSEQRTLGGAELGDQLQGAVLRGLGLLVDKLVFDAIDAATPETFDFGKMAARNVGFGDITAVIGTSGQGATVWQDGMLRSKEGIPARLTAGHAKSFAGVFSRAFVAVWPTVNIHAKRMDANGNLDISVFANARAVLPTAALDFFAVAA
ncbi:hypothetical protein [Pandoraea sp. NPDC087047]|uniref:hypothetical protein n=1 Tax=Pandoraea sp. NPDC087047 TaxID=3364390 RepID=UPI0037F73D02